MQHDPSRPPLPRIPPPARFVDRRRSFRRAEDRVVHEERALLARAVDILARPDDAATQVAEILALVARVVGARRAALAIDRPVRRVLAAAGPDEDPRDARDLGAWLDAGTPRPAAVRAASAPAEVVVVRTRRGPPGVMTRPAAGTFAARLLRLEIPGASGSLGLELASPAHAAAATDRLPVTTMRHLLAVLAAAASRVAAETELADLRARERERERFVSMVAHELRTPLTGLGGYLDLLAAGAVDDPEIGHEFVERGRGIVERMAGLVGDLLELSRLEAGSLRLEIGPISLAEAVERAAASVEPIAAGRGIRLVLECPPRIRTVRADRRRVEQVVTNLLGNACKFAPEGGLVEVAATIDGRVGVVAVRDDGPGMERADRATVFRPFARLEGHERIPGTGLGLPISRDLARAMGGDVGVAAVAGSGSSFVLVLPATSDTENGAIADALAGAIEREEVALEERAILRAMRAAARPSRPVASERGSSAAPAPSVDAA